MGVVVLQKPEHFVQQEAPNRCNMKNCELYQIDVQQAAYSQMQTNSSVPLYFPSLIDEDTALSVSSDLYELIVFCYDH